MPVPVANPVLSDRSSDLVATAVPLALEKGKVIAWCALGVGVLRVTSGRLWVTLDVAPRSPLYDMGDHMVILGHDLRLRAAVADQCERVARGAAGRVVEDGDGGVGRLHRLDYATIIEIWKSPKS